VLVDHDRLVPPGEHLESNTARGRPWPARADALLDQRGDRLLVEVESPVLLTLTKPRRCPSTVTPGGCGRPLIHRALSAAMPLARTRPMPSRSTMRAKPRAVESQKTGSRARPRKYAADAAVHSAGG
jgi:hypothetical protein